MLRAWPHRARVLEAVLLMAAAGVLQKVVPMTRWVRLIGPPRPVPGAWLGHTTRRLPQVAATPVERHVALAVRRGVARLPWEPTCLAQAVAGQVMLRQRHQPGAVVIGLRRPEAEASAWDAHAWLVGAAGVLTGGPAAQGFTATAVFTPVPDWSPEWSLDARP